MAKADKQQVCSVTFADLSPCISCTTKECRLIDGNECDKCKCFLEVKSKLEAIDKESNNVALKPIPFRISQWGSGTQVLHKCAKCGASFQIYEDKQLFCHMCGKKINWDGVVLYCTKEEAARYHNSCNKEFKQGEQERLEILFKLYQEGNKNVGNQ